MEGALAEWVADCSKYDLPCPFYCELLAHENKTISSELALARAHTGRISNPAITAEILGDSPSLVLYKATALLALGKSSNANQILLKATPMLSGVELSLAWTLLAQAYRSQVDHESAANAFSKALDASPLNWTAFEGLCSTDPNHSTLSNVFTRTAMLDILESKKVKTRSEFENVPENLSQEAMEIDKQDNLLEYVITVAEMVKALSQFRTLAVIKAYSGTINCPTTMRLVAKAHFERNEYSAASRMYEQAFSVYNRSDLRGLEYYSTALWHEGRSIDLASLANDALRVDKLHPNSWIVLGNLHSLQKNRANAIKYFQRAIEVDPTCSYAYTLVAHEYLSNEDMDRATEHYRKAKSLDPKNYVAWYGLGNVYSRQDRHDYAVFHYKRAGEINSSSSVLRCYLGVALNACGKTEDALVELNMAAVMMPSNPQPRFHTAKIHILAAQYDIALDELLQVLKLAPHEAVVYMELGRVYFKLGNVESAVMSLTTAMDLDPKDKALVKEASDLLLEISGSS